MNKKNGISWRNRLTLNEYGYSSREDYLFQQSITERFLTVIGVAISTQDLYEALAENTEGAWDLIQKNLDSVDMDRLKSYHGIVGYLRRHLKAQIVNLNSQIADLRSKNLGVMYGVEINSLSFDMWDKIDQLNVVDDEYSQIYKAIYWKTYQ